MDQLLKGIVKNRPLRVYIVDATLSAKKACAAQQTTPVASVALSRLISVGAMVAGMLKDKNGRLTLKIDGDGPLKQLLVDATVDGKVRGFVANPAINLALNGEGRWDVGGAIGKGTLTVIKSLGMSRDFSGEVALQTGEIGDDFCYYFLKSEQTPSAVIVGAIIAKDFSVKAAGGIIIQTMPGAEEDDIRYAENKTALAGNISALIDKEKDVAKIARLIFGDDLEILTVTPVKWYCNCSKNRFLVGVSLLRKQEILDMIEEDEGCEIKCAFCNKTYRLDKDDLQEALRMRGAKN